MNADAVRAMLRHEITRRESLRAAAREWGCSAPYLSDVLNGATPPGPKVLRALGLRRVVSYVPVEEAASDVEALAARVKLLNDVIGEHHATMLGGAPR